MPMLDCMCLSRTSGGDPVAVHEFLHQMKSFQHKRGNNLKRLSHYAGVCLMRQLLLVSGVFSDSDAAFRRDRLKLTTTLRDTLSA